MNEGRCRCVTQVLGRAGGLGNNGTLMRRVIRRFEIACGQHPDVVRILEGF